MKRLLHVIDSKVHIVANFDLCIYQSGRSSKGTVMHLVTPPVAGSSRRSFGPTLIIGIQTPIETRTVEKEEITQITGGLSIDATLAVGYVQKKTVGIQYRDKALLPKPK